MRKANFFITFFLVATSVAIGKIVDAQGLYWSGSFLFITIIFMLIGNRLIIRIQSGEWKAPNEWLYFPLYLLILVGLWLWVRVWDVAFIVIGGFAFYFWLDHLRDRLEMSDRDSHAPH
jgi:hypothetical protein